MIQISTPLSLAKQNSSQFAISGNKQKHTGWMPVMKLGNAVLLDTTLDLNDSLILKWKTVGNKPIQQFILKTKMIKPLIAGFRINEYFDSMTQGQKIRVLKRKKALPKGFIALKSDSIEIKAGGILELKLKPYPLLTDTIIYYRIVSKNESLILPWRSGSHVLTLPELQADNNYILELKYPNQSETSRYFLIHKPFWYQLTWVQWVMGISLLTALLVSVRWYYRRKIRLISAQRQRLEEQLTTIQSQLNPHFIFNALSSIEGLVSTGENKLANEYLTTFSMIMRETLKNTDKMLISLKEEIALLEKYISIEELRFGFNCTIKIDPDIRPDEIQVPPMLAQPLIENAVKHGAAADGILIVAIDKNENDMVITVTNNKADHKTDPQTAGGYGLTFTQQRLKHFSTLNPQTPISFSFIEHESTVEARLTFTNWFA
ncbi:sensor histidine kinase [Sediminibacterium sp.]|uniref:sensor histidine kinase n=1 Tax=Sediminibacterium sp. TaxID=1917865 RepID=UPI003F696360